MNTKHPLRVLTIIWNKSEAWEQSPEEIIQFSLQAIADKNLYDITEISASDTKLLTIQNHRTRKIFGFDIRNESYDAAKGHLPEQNKLPVVVVHLGGRENIAFQPRPAECARINENVRFLHDANGFGSTPPFIENHLGTPPSYPNARCQTHSGEKSKTQLGVPESIVTEPSMAE